jgi:hypothetical protein
MPRTRQRAPSARSLHNAHLVLLYRRRRRRPRYASSNDVGLQEPMPDCGEPRGRLPEAKRRSEQFIHSKWCGVRKREEREGLSSTIDLDHLPIMNDSDQHNAISGQSRCWH